MGTLFVATILVLVGVKIPAAWDPTFNLIAKANCMCINCRFTYHWIPGVCSSRSYLW